MHHQHHQPASHYLLLVGALLGISLLTWLDPLDYRIFAHATRAWLNGSSQLYDAGAPQFFYAPWSLVLLVPLAPLPDRVGQAALNLLSLVSIVWGVQTLIGPLRSGALMLALLSPFVASVLLLGQWDGLLLGAAALSWRAVERQQPWLLGLALVMLTTKPTNVLVLLVVLLWCARGWSLRAWIGIVVPPLVALVLSLLMCGSDWPLRYVQFVRQTAPAGFDVSLWQYPFGVVLAVLGAGWFGWCCFRWGVNAHTITLALLIGLVISPRVVPYQYIMTIPALAWVVGRHWRVGVVLWVLSMIVFLAYVLERLGPPLVMYLVLLTAACTLLYQPPIARD